MEQYVNPFRSSTDYDQESKYPQIPVPKELQVRLDNKYGTMSIDQLSNISDRILLIFSGRDKLLGRFVPTSSASFDIVKKSLTLVDRQDVLRLVVLEDKDTEIRDQELCSVLPFADIKIFYALDEYNGKLNIYGKILSLMDGLNELVPTQEQLNPYIGIIQNDLRFSEAVPRMIELPSVVKGEKEKFLSYASFTQFDANGYIFFFQNEQIPGEQEEITEEILQDGRTFYEGGTVFIVLVYYKKYLSPKDIQSLSDIVAFADTEYPYLREALKTHIYNLISSQGANLINYDNFPLPDWMKDAKLIKKARPSSEQSVNAGLSILGSSEIKTLTSKDAKPGFIDPWFISNSGYRHWLPLPRDPKPRLPDVERIALGLGDWVPRLDYTKTYLVGYPIIAAYTRPKDVSRYAPATYISLSKVSDIEGGTIGSWINRTYGTDEAISEAQEDIKNYFRADSNLILTEEGTLVAYDSYRNLTFDVQLINPVKIIVVTDDPEEFNAITLQHANTILEYNPTLVIQQLNTDAYIMRDIPPPGTVTKEIWNLLHKRSIIIYRVPNITQLEAIVLQQRVPLERCCYGIVEDGGAPGLYLSACCLMTSKIRKGNDVMVVGLYLDSINDVNTMSLVQYPEIGNPLGMNNIPSDGIVLKEIIKGL